MNPSSILMIESDCSLQSYYTVNNLYRLLKERSEKRVFENIYLKYAADISSVFNYFNNEFKNPEYNSHLATLELQAIMLRLSRHHIKRAKIIENISNFFKEILLCNSKIIKEIQFQNAELIDRPSLMIINRLAGLIQNNLVGLRIKFIFKKNVFNPTTEQNLLKARNQVFCKLDRLIQIKKNSYIKKKLASLSDFKLNDALYNSKILDAAIIEQNYELAFLILETSLNSSQNKKILSDHLIYRNLGVLEANLGNFDTALINFNAAIETSETVIELSRNSYIKGLFLIKRFKNVEGGLKVIDQALENLNSKYLENDVKYKHEKAWLINGQCLGRTILASSQCKEVKEKIILEIIKNEMEAYKIISQEKSFYLVYLKFNLLANIAFLLEILGQYAKSIEFLEKAFAPVLVNDGEYLEGEKALTYRLGILNFKLSNLDSSINLLERSLYLTRNEGNPFHLNVILYGLGYVKLFTNDKSEDLLALLIEGRNLSLHLHDDNAYKQFELSIQCLIGNVNISDLIPPKVKLISYVPYIDLSFVPEIDLNKELTS